MREPPIYHHATARGSVASWVAGNAILKMHSQQLQPAPAPSVSPFRPLSKEDVADVLGITVRCLEQRVEQGLVPRWRKLGNRSVYHPDVFFGWLDGYLKSDESRDVEPAAEPLSQKPIKKHLADKSGVGASNARRLELIEQIASRAA